MNELFLRDVKVDARVGAWESEKKGPQPLMLSLELSVERAKADALESVVSYEWVLEQVREVCKRPHRVLLETLCDEVTDALFADARITAVKMSVYKVGLFEGVGAAGVTCERSRS